jgi:hypothetical protein
MDTIASSGRPGGWAVHVRPDGHSRIRQAKTPPLLPVAVAVAVIAVVRSRIETSTMVMGTAKPTNQNHNVKTHCGFETIAVFH